MSLNPDTSNTFSLGTNTAKWLSLNVSNIATTTLNINNVLYINENGVIEPLNTNVRTIGLYGIYDSNKISHIWSIGANWTISTDGSTFGNIHGIAYKYQDSNGAGNPSGGVMTNGHQIAFLANGVPHISIGLTGNIWNTGIYTSTGNMSVANAWSAIWNTTAVFYNSEQYVTPNSYQAILRWSNVITGAGYRGRFAIGSVRTTDGYGAMVFSLGVDDAGTSGIRLALNTNGYATWQGAFSADRLYAGWDSGVAGSVSCGNWFRSNGATGWHNETFGGGIYMEDTKWVKIFNNKQFYVSNTEDATSAASQASILTEGGINVRRNIWANGDIIAVGKIVALGLSDERLKENFRPVKAGELLSAIPIMMYDYTDEAQNMFPGVPKTAISAIYQQAVKVFPGMDAKQKGHTYNHLDKDFIYTIAATAQQNYREIRQFEQRIAELEKELSKYQSHAH